MITLYMPTPKNGQTPGLSQKRCVTQEILLSEETLCYLYCPAPSFNANLNSAHLIMFSLLVLLLPATTYAWYLLQALIVHQPKGSSKKNWYFLGIIP